MQLPDWKNLPDWQACEDKLFTATVNALENFAKEFPDVAISNLAFDSSPYYGDVLIGFDTFQKSLEDVLEKQSAEVAKWRKALSGDYDWRLGEEMSDSHLLEKFPKVPKIDTFLYSYLKFGNNTGDFSHSQYASVDFEEWRKVAAEEWTRESDEPDEYSSDEYLEANAALMFWKVIDRLIAGNHLEKIKKTAVFFLGYTFHDEDPVILRIVVE